MGATDEGPPGKGDRPVDRVARRNRALELRKHGHSYAEIAAELGYTERRAAADVRSALRALAKRESQITQRDLETQRLDVATVAIAGKVEQGDLAAVDRWVAISKHRSKLLGLDKPVVDEGKVEPLEIIVRYSNAEGND